MTGVLDLLLPATCPVCRRRRPGPAPCVVCVDALAPPPAMRPPPGVDSVHAVLAYEDAGREVVARLKYRNARSTVAWLADRMATLVVSSLVAMPAVGARLADPGTFGTRATLGTLGGPATWVTWIPTSSDRRLERGFDQSELLARAVARRLGLPCRRLLVRDRGPPQTGRSRTERRLGPPLVARGRAPATVVLVDDVITTGSSARVAAAALRSAGATRVVLVAAARTPHRAAASTR